MKFCSLRLLNESRYALRQFSGTLTHEPPRMAKLMHHSATLPYMSWKPHSFGSYDPTRASRIDASKVPLYLYSGEYDFTCPPALIEQTAKDIGPQVHYEMLKGLGHFPMSEDYALFRPTLVKTLNDIEAKHAAAERAA